MKRIDVAVGLVFDQAGRVLVGQRTLNDRYVGKWEFPGGKLEPGESPSLALARELHEELGIYVTQSEPWTVLEHDYPDRQVRLHVLRVLAYSGTAAPREAQPLRWLAPAKIQQLDFLQGNQPIIERLLAEPAPTAD